MPTFSRRRLAQSQPTALKGQSGWPSAVSARNSTRRHARLRLARAFTRMILISIVTSRRCRKPVRYTTAAVAATLRGLAYTRYSSSKIDTECGCPDTRHGHCHGLAGADILEPYHYQCCSVLTPGNQNAFPGVSFSTFNSDQ
jgi:hypothetical protein